MNGASILHDQKSDHPANDWLGTVRKFLELIRFSHTIFALPFALLATFWAYVIPLPGSHTNPNDASPTEYLVLRWRDLIGIVVCMVMARSFAMAVNRLLDHRIDAMNPRTARRHLPAGLLSKSSVVAFTMTCAVGFVVTCFLFLPNRLPIYLSLPVLGFLAGYSLTKRFTRFAHFWLGVALMLAPICAWIALRGEILPSNPVDLLPVVTLGSIVLFWVAGFDIIYACQDFEYDRQAGLFSIPSKLGIDGALLVAKACHAAMWSLAFMMTYWFPQLSLGWLFRGSLMVVGALLVWEHASVSSRSLEKINLAFFQLNSVISVVFLVAGSLDAWWR